MTKIQKTESKTAWNYITDRRDSSDFSRSREISTKESREIAQGQNPKGNPLETVECPVPDIAESVEQQETVNLKPKGQTLKTQKFSRSDLRNSVADKKTAFFNTVSGDIFLFTRSLSQGGINKDSHGQKKYGADHIEKFYTFKYCHNCMFLITNKLISHDVIESANPTKAISLGISEVKNTGITII